MISRERLVGAIKQNAFNMALKLAEHNYIGYVFYYGACNNDFNRICDDDNAIELWDNFVQEAMDEVNRREGSNLTMADFDWAYENYIVKFY